MLQDFRVDTTKALKEVEKKYNIKITLGGITFGSTYFSGRFKAQEIGAESKEAIAYKRYQSLYQLPPLGTNFMYQGKTYTITGYNSRAHRSPVQLSRSGKSMRASVEFIKTFAGKTVVGAK